MSGSPFASSVRYQLQLTGKPFATADGFQVGLYAICTDVRTVNEHNELVAAHFVDHWPSGLTYVWCDTFALALEIADAASVATGDARELAELQRAMAAVDFAGWTTHVLQASASGQARQRFAEWQATKKGTGAE